MSARYINITHYKYLLKCYLYNERNNKWMSENLYFDYIGEVVDFIKKGGIIHGDFIAPEHISVINVYKLTEVNMDEFLN